MTTQHTQERIVATATQLFNQFGAKDVSVNLIAQSAGISRGHLHYHYRRKEEIIQDIFSRVARQTEANWNGDANRPTLAHMREMFRRCMVIMWEYRFLHRELGSLQHHDPVLRDYVELHSQKRLVHLNQFFEALIDAGVMRRPEHQTLDALIKVMFMVANNWFSYALLRDERVCEERVDEGVATMLCVLRPYLKERAPSTLVLAALAATVPAGVCARAGRL